ncbi:hypothetical protein [Lyngbya confervoides]|uniref:Antitoxin n=1 Tax=Lyngbya confervoides BDU141951 TaxID=1574623 RepID=A0ABD4T623_9CYAN|nr:hypothetical protein [Lyngbya confervoides]MCM1983948.1 hypothetical protein [Lyngbya confervoides BDU141951]
MLKSYEAIYKNGQFEWLHEEPAERSARVIVTVLEVIDPEQPIRRRVPPASIAGKAQILGDIVSPIVDEEDWECLK